jgi:nucleoside-diphosphate-sugar epimerase
MRTALTATGVETIHAGKLGAVEAGLTDDPFHPFRTAGRLIAIKRKPARLDDPASNELDCTRLHAAYGWKAATTLRTGIQQIWDWLRTL